MVSVEVREDDNIQLIIKRFKKKCIMEGIPQDLRKNTYYEKPSERKRRKRIKAIRRLRRRNTISQN